MSISISTISKKDVILLAVLVAGVLVAMGLDIACTVYIMQTISERWGLFIAATVFNVAVVGAIIWLVIHLKNMLAAVAAAKSVPSATPAA